MIKMNEIKNVLAVIAITGLAFNVTAADIPSKPDDNLYADEPDSRVLWYSQPAADWQKQALPLGNGSLGCMVFGGVENEHIQFNHDTLWVGGEKDTGAYHAFGDIYINFGHADAKNYRRQLDISRAVHTVTYVSNGTKYKREYFSSNPDQVMVFRFTAD
jgi:alpha-L-fucosidase 2